MYIQILSKITKKNCFISTPSINRFWVIPFSSSQIMLLMSALFLLIMSQEKQGFLDRNTKVSSVYRVDFCVFIIKLNFDVKNL
jgi:hypothetical protein